MGVIQMTTAPKRSEASVAAAKPAEEKAVKAASVKVEAPAAVKTEAPKAESKKPAARKAAEKKPAEKKPAAKKAAAPKANIVVEYQGRQVMQADILAGAERVWAQAGRTEAIKTMELYVKPEDGAVYCVINGESVGKFSF
ncbi:hypothetical protein GMD88_06275 [Pseudoflavonifractor sp. BIOML-A6]|nr:hypothetical protein [Pseudoflavonifractor sp. BIOML-A16]MTR05161.1 hypothetical protein [Pseudoflavonifractor sp. BIOML-A15]MTR12736.1 hypothetical protein [Pseudoflavonifractor sp. BIOML-A17]MTR22240.1 hypothetical protein [Pseudoflavonifractor sp. BIOML-A19]MTR35153.1 hypothetical protein [Pseudoflavonifractor sp. BIOML-A9]MTR45037.1 hypothetical protein [Pseudoflavonifractor sp. BIOML-A13]MTR48741.1 hypothetical protein [Pseudoflavonifractor sp. BIOML-A11]MTR73776.1 hypothetical prote